MSWLARLLATPKTDSERARTADAIRDERGQPEQVLFLPNLLWRETAVALLLLAGTADRFTPGSVTAFPAGKFYLVRLADGGFLALHRQCTHLGCSVPWDEASGRFACPCHGSAFDLRGDVLAPPAPRPLDLFPVRIENGIVKVDLAAPIRRSAFDPSQVARG